MESLIITIIISLLASPLVYAESKSEFLPLKEGNYWTYQDKIEIQDEKGNVEIENKYIREKVKVRRINQLRTIKVISVETRGDFKIAKMQEEGTPQGIVTFFYVVDNKNGRIYSYSNEQIKAILPNNKDVNIEGSPEYVFPLKVGLKWGDPESLKRKDNMYVFYVENVEDVSVPAGTFKNCFKIVNHTLPDETVVWFCPNVGVVKLEYRHHGTIDNLVGELKERGER